MRYPERYLEMRWIVIWGGRRLSFRQFQLILQKFVGLFMYEEPSDQRRLTPDSGSRQRDCTPLLLAYQRGSAGTLPGNDELLHLAGHLGQQAARGGDLSQAGGKVPVFVNCRSPGQYKSERRHTSVLKSYPSPETTSLEPIKL